MINKENVAEWLGQTFLSEKRERVAPTEGVEMLGRLTDLNRTKKANMDQHQYTLRG